MLQVTKIVDEDVSDKVDLQRIDPYLKSLNLHNVFVFILCTKGDDWKQEEVWQEDGTTNVDVTVPYEEVKASANPFEVIKARIDKRIERLREAA
jgi:hypothetical protein